uniref:Kinesin motor domain-containing protein n=1 Tax=Syphacia muris TaxID=451379 RepID=A0A0N5AZQ2_9BILA
MTDCVKVAVRTRPFSVKEKAEGASECLEYFVDNNQIAINGRFFAFDVIFDPVCSQENVYETCAAPLVEKLFAGYNCTIIAYGQTGSGKTYTIGTEETEQSLSDENRGVIPRIVDAIFRQADNSTAYSLSVSMLEVYEEKILDLLSSSKDPLQIREKDGATFVQGLTCEPVFDLMSTMRELEKGGRMRSKGETAMNLKSSRSHAIFTIFIDKAPTEQNEGSFKSKLAIVDLAGSERLKKTLAEGERLKEGIKINSGLLALGNVISALVEQGPNSGHIPYRDSKITRLLQDSLGGNSYTVMIACVSPADTNAEETLSTLRYADRAKKIRNKPVVNTDPNLAVIQELRQQLAIAKHELAQYRTGEHQSEISSTFRFAYFLIASLLLSNVFYFRFDDFKKFTELQNKYDKLLDENRHTQLQLVDVIAENGHNIAQLTTAQEEIEKLHDVVENVRQFLQKKNDDFNTFPAATEILQMLELPNDGRLSIDEEVILGKNEEEGNGESGEDFAYPSRYAENQKKLADLINEIKNKERAVEATMATEQEIQKIRERHAIEVEELKAKLEELQQERNDLILKLKGSSNHNKFVFIVLVVFFNLLRIYKKQLLRVSEQRRKRVQELEKEISSNRKRLAEIAKLEKEKATLQEKAQKLSAELQELKKLRVKMAKQMKEEETKFRSWKIKAEHELIQLKNRERKREAVMAREAAMSKQQLAVYRQKYEEASACNRRLQQQLCAAAKRKMGEKTDEQINAFLDQELELAFSAAEAEVHCKVLIEQRKNLSARHRKLAARLKRMLDRPPTKRRTGSDRSSIDDENEVNQIRSEIADLQSEIELRNTELRDIQQKCAKAGDDSHNDQRWNSIRSLVTAKVALKRIFENLVNEKREAFDKDRLIEELKRVEMEKVKENEEMKSYYEHLVDEGKRTNEELKRALSRAEYVNTEKELHKRRSTRLRKSRNEILSYNSPSIVYDKIDGLSESDDDSKFNTYDANDATYYPTPELRQRQKILNATRNRKSANPADSAVAPELILRCSNKEQVSKLKNQNQNETFTIDEHEDDDNKVPPTLLSKKASSASHLQRLTRTLFDGF